MGLVRIKLGGGLGLDADSRASGVLEPSALDVSDPDLKRFALCSCATISSAVIIGATRAGPLDLREAAAIAALIRIAGVVTFGRFAFAGTANVLTPGSAGSLLELAGVGAGSTLTAVPISSGASAAACVAERSPDPRLYRE